MRPYSQLDRRGQARRLADAAKRWLSEHEGLRPLSLKLLSHQHNTGFRAEGPDGLSFVRLSRTSDRTADQVADEAAFLSRAAAVDIACPAPLGIFAKGPAVLDDPQLGIPRLLMRFTWLDGRGAGRLQAEHARDLGRLTAQLHELDLEGIGAHRWVVDGFVVGSGADADSGARAIEEALGPEARRVAQEVYRRYDALRPALGPVRLLHGDLHPWNLLWSGDRVQVFDFDDCGWGPLAYDLCVPLREILEIDRGDLVTPLLEGYAEVRPLPPGIPDALPLLCQARAVQLVAWIVSERTTPGFEWWGKWSRGRLQAMEAYLSTHPQGH